jgi:hypothetical protein
MLVGRVVTACADGASFGIDSVVAADLVPPQGALPGQPPPASPADRQPKPSPGHLAGQPARHQGHDRGRHRPADQSGITRFPT